MPTILLVEDDATLAETLRYNLEREGYAVISASDGVTCTRIRTPTPA
jgi:DNA-binding response OmpR family regulator